MTNVADAFALGLQQQRHGKLDEAINTFHQVLRLAPENGEAHNALGNALQNQGRLPEAMDHFSQALRIKPDYPEAHNNLGNAYLLQKKLDEAVIEYQHAVRLRPEYAAAHNNLGMALASMGAVIEAMDHYRHALRINPNLADTYNNLGNALLECNKPQEAVEQFQHALRIKPHFAKVHYNLGIALKHLGKLDEAIRCYRQCLQLNPQSAEAYCNLGVALEKQHQIDEAIDCYRHALQLKPSNAELWNNLGFLLQQQDKAAEAIQCYQQSLANKSQFVLASTNMGNLYWAQGRFDEAIVYYDQSISWDAESPATHFNRARVKLLQGHWLEGWPEYEWRWKTSEYPGYNFAQPRWEGAAMPSATVLLVAEQGHGDTLQFVRYAPLVKERVGRVLVECQAKLLPLLASMSGIDQLIARSCPLPAFDLYVPFLSLPGLFSATPDNVPAAVPYLRADGAKVEYWRNQLSTIQGFKVGIAWQGNPGFLADPQRSVPLTEFAPLARLPGVQLISLQKAAGAEQLAELAGKFRVLDLSCRLDENTGAFMDTAAVMAGLDLVISSDSAIVHVAGAIGVPVWVALPFVPDWRWLLERDDSPWYPSMRLFRQAGPGPWTEVFERIARELGSYQLSAT